MFGLYAAVVLIWGSTWIAIQYQLSVAPEVAVAEAMIADNARQLRFALAVDRVIDGDSHAVADLKASAGPELGPAWRIYFALWALVPQLAGPMLAYRRRRNARGAGAPDAETATIRKVLPA